MTKKSDVEKLIATVESGEKASEQEKNCCSKKTCCCGLFKGWTKWTVLAHTVSLLTMVGPGLFGTLLIDKLILDKAKNLHDVIRFGINLTVFIGSVEGKRRLMLSFNLGNFQSLPMLWPNFKKLSSWEKSKKALFIFFSLPSSLLFAGLKREAFLGCGKMLYDYQIEAADAAADVFSSIWFQLTFMLAAFLSNIFAYPGIHELMWNTVASLIQFCKDNLSGRVQGAQNSGLEQRDVYLRELSNKLNFEGQDFRRAEEHLRTTIANYNMTAVDAQIESSQGLLGKIDALKNANPDTLKAAINTQAIEITQSFPDYSLNWKQKFALAAAPAVLTIACYVGQAFLLDMVSIVAGFTGIQSSGVKTLWRILVMSSQVGLAYAAVFLPAHALFKSLTKKQPYTFVHPPLTEKRLWCIEPKIYILALSIATCLVGAAPNIYQAVLADFHPALIILAGVSSFFIEVFGFHALTTGQALAGVEVSDEDQAIRDYSETVGKCFMQNTDRTPLLNSPNKGIN